MAYSCNPYGEPLLQLYGELQVRIAPQRVVVCGHLCAFSRCKGSEPFGAARPFFSDVQPLGCRC